MADSEVPVADEDAWLYESKETGNQEAPPDIVDPAVSTEDSQEDEQVTVIEESHTDEKDSSEKPSQEEEEEDEDDDDEDDVEITIGDPKAAPAPASAINTSTTFTATPVNLNIKKTITTTTAVTSVPGGQLIKPAQKGLDVEAVATINGTSIYEFNIDSLEEKPWRKPGADITDYFNYGFTEDSWKIYCDRQRRTRAENNVQINKGPMGQIPSTIPLGGGYDKPYRPSYPPREFKDFRKTGTIDVIGGQNSRRPPNVEEMNQPMMPPMNDMTFPPGLPPINYDPHIPPPHQNMPPPSHGMSMHPPFDPRFPPPTMDMVGPPPFPPGAHDPYGGAPPMQPQQPMMDPYHRPEERPIEDLEYDRRRHDRRYDDMSSRSRDDREDRDSRRHRDRGDDRRDRERDDRRDRSDRDRDRNKEKDRERDRDRDRERDRSSRKSRRHDDDDDDRRSSKHKRSKRDDE